MIWSISICFISLKTKNNTLGLRSGTSFILMIANRYDTCILNNVILLVTVTTVPECRMFGRITLCRACSFKSLADYNNVIQSGAGIGYKPRAETDNELPISHILIPEHLSLTSVLYIITSNTNVTINR